MLALGPNRPPFKSPSSQRGGGSNNKNSRFDSLDGRGKQANEHSCVHPINQTNTQTNKQTHTHTHTQPYNQTNKQTHKQTYKQRKKERKKERKKNRKK